MSKLLPLLRDDDTPTYKTKRNTRQKALKTFLLFLLLFYRSLSEFIKEMQKILLSWKPLNEVLWYGHSNKSFSSKLSLGTISFLRFYKMKLVIFLKLFWPVFYRLRMPSFVYHTVLPIYVPSISLLFYPFLRLTLIDCPWLRGRKCILLTPLSVTKETLLWLLIETQLAQI